MTDQHSSAIESHLQETRRFAPPSAETAGMPRWHISSLDQYRALHQRSIDDPESFWAEIASELHWFEPWSKVLEWRAPDAKWFVGGKTNLCYNCVDRQVDNGHADDPAIVWEGEPLPDNHAPETRTLTYRDLQRETARFANVLKGLGVQRGDVVTIYMGMVPELAIAMLACARIGAMHSIIFGGFSPTAIADRVTDANSRIIITCDGAWRRGNIVPLKENVDAACRMLVEANAPTTVDKVVVLNRCSNNPPMATGRDLSWHDLTAEASDHCPCTPMDSEDPLFLLYTSGS
ncbi:MAG: AMP-binding protein, partial [Phycisphaerales bacterium JB037]